MYLRTWSVFHRSNRATALPSKQIRLPCNTGNTGWWLRISLSFLRERLAMVRTIKAFAVFFCNGSYSAVGDFLLAIFVNDLCCLAMDQLESALEEIKLTRCDENKRAFVKYFLEKDKVGGLKMFTKSADAGDPLAAYLVALGHIDTDAKLAFKYMLLSAQDCHPRALILCANMYKRGLGVEQSDVAAMALYRKAAITWDNGEAMFKLAELILKISDDKKEALNWFAKAHECGYPQAGLNVAKMWMSGKGVEKNAEKAVDMHRKLLKENCMISRRVLAQCLCLGEGCDQDLSAAFDLYKEGADVFNDGYCMVCLANAARYGSGLKGPDLPMAIEYFKKSAAKGFVAAMHELGDIYRETGNYKRAMQWYLKSVKEGHEESKTALGDMHRDGLGVPKSESLSQRWYKTVLS